MCGCLGLPQESIQPHEAAVVFFVFRIIRGNTLQHLDRTLQRAYLFVEPREGSEE